MVSCKPEAPENPPHRGHTKEEIIKMVESLVEPQHYLPPHYIAFCCQSPPQRLSHTHGSDIHQERIF
jgi:hypothetical protein